MCVRERIENRKRDRLLNDRQCRLCDVRVKIHGMRSYLSKKKELKCTTMLTYAAQKRERDIVIGGVSVFDILLLNKMFG